MAADEGHGVISHVLADFADHRDSTLLPSIIEPLAFAFWHTYYRR